MRLAPLILLAIAAAGMPGPAFADAARDALLAEYLAQAKKDDPSFTAFSAERGGEFFRAKQTAGDPRTPSCTSCHGGDPRQAGKHVETGKAIDPMAVSANPKRYTDKAEVEKWFRRNCKQVLGRACSAKEKGDFVTFMTGQ